MYLQLYYAGVHKRCKLYMFRVSTKHISSPHSVYLLTYKYIRSHPIKKCDWNWGNQHLGASYIAAVQFLLVSSAYKEGGNTFWLAKYNWNFEYPWKPKAWKTVPHWNCHLSKK